MFLQIPLLILISSEVVSLRSPAAETATNSIFSNRVSIAVFRFENATGDFTQDFWGYTADTIFRNSLHEIKGLHSLPDPSLDYALRKLQLKSGSSLSVTQAQQLGNLVQAQRVITGSYQRTGTQWQLTLRVLNVPTGTITTNLTATSSDWFALRDQLAGPLLDALGITATTAERDRMLARWTKSSTAVEWVTRARAAFKEKQPASVWQQCARRALDSDPNCAEAYVVLAASEGTQGSFGAARSALNKAVKINPGMARAHLGLGSVAIVSGHSDEAAVPLQTAAQLDPDNADIFNRQGELAALAKDFPAAIYIYQHALQLSPYEATLHANLARIHALQGNRDDALRELAAAENVVAEGDFNSERTIAQTYVRLNVIPPAIQHYEKIVIAAQKAGVTSRKIQEDEKELRRLQSK